MSRKPHPTITMHFASLKDPRTGNAARHRLLDILVIAICASLCGADTWVDVETWGRAKENWLRQFLELPNGIPAHDTFGRVFALLDPQAFRKCFLGWIHAIQKLTHHQVVAIDGKTLRRSHDLRLGKKVIASRECVGQRDNDTAYALAFVMTVRPELTSGRICLSLILNRFIK